MTIPRSEPFSERVSVTLSKRAEQYGLDPDDPLLPVFDQIEQSYLNHERLTQQLHDTMTRLQREVEQIQDLDKTRNEDTAGYVKQHGEKIVQKSVSNLTDTIGTDVINLVRERMTALSIRTVLHLSAILCIAFAGVFAGGSIVGFYGGARYTTYTMTQGSVSAQVFHDLQIKQPATAEWWAKKIHDNAAFQDRLQAECNAHLHIDPDHHGRQFCRIPLWLDSQEPDLPHDPQEHQSEDDKLY